MLDSISVHTLGKGNFYQSLRGQIVELLLFLIGRMNVLGKSTLIKFRQTAIEHIVSHISHIHVDNDEIRGKGENFIFYEKVVENRRIARGPGVYYFNPHTLRIEFTLDDFGQAFMFLNNSMSIRVPNVENPVDAGWFLLRHITMLRPRLAIG